jgi:hypothetical protein
MSSRGFFLLCFGLLETRSSVEGSACRREVGELREGRCSFTGFFSSAERAKTSKEIAMNRASLACYGRSSVIKQRDCHGRLETTPEGVAGFAVYSLLSSLPIDGSLGGSSLQYPQAAPPTLRLQLWLSLRMKPPVQPAPSVKNLICSSTTLFNGSTLTCAPASLTLVKAALVPSSETSAATRVNQTRRCRKKGLRSREVPGTKSSSVVRVE